MQLAKYHWKKVRNTDRFTISADRGFRCRRGGFKSHDEKSQELMSRLKNPADPINAN